MRKTLLGYTVDEAYTRCMPGRRIALTFFLQLFTMVKKLYAAGLNPNLDRAKIEDVQPEDGLVHVVPSIKR